MQQVQFPDNNNEDQSGAAEGDTIHNKVVLPQSNRKPFFHS